MSSRSITLLSSLVLKIQHASHPADFKHTDCQPPDAWNTHTPSHLRDRSHRSGEHYRSGLCAVGMSDRLASDGMALFLPSCWGVAGHLLDSFLILGNAIRALGPLDRWIE